MYQVIQLHPAAPDKPPKNHACNGCGVCCASEPCPLGVMASRRFRGACSALVWLEDGGIYRCGLIEQPSSHLPRWLRWATPMLTRLARRYISAGSGCDYSASVEPGV